MTPTQNFAQVYKTAWETRDDKLLCSLFAPDGVYHNTPFDQQAGHAAISKYWDRVKLQDEIRVACQVLVDLPRSGIIRWQVTYRVTSDEMFRMWAASSGTAVPAREPGAPLPRLALDGIGVCEFDPSGLCTVYRIWWHSRMIG